MLRSLFPELRSRKAAHSHLLSWFLAARSRLRPLLPAGAYFSSRTRAPRELCTVPAAPPKVRRFPTSGILARSQKHSVCIPAAWRRCATCAAIPPVICLICLHSVPAEHYGLTEVCVQRTASCLCTTGGVAWRRGWRSPGTELKAKSVTLAI